MNTFFLGGWVIFNFLLFGTSFIMGSNPGMMMVLLGVALPFLLAFAGSWFIAFKCTGPK